MTISEKIKCHFLIHCFALACGAGNAVPTPGVGIAVDLAGMASMCMGLAAIFSDDATDQIKKGLLIATIKRYLTKEALKELAKKGGTKKVTQELAKLLAFTVLKREGAKVAAKEASKTIPVLGTVLSSTMSVCMIEAAGWKIAKDMDEARRELAA